MTDIHMHLLPGVDDGARDTTTALLMLKCAEDEGVDTVFATPHSEAFDRGENAVRYIYESFCAQAAKFLPQIRIRLGCEVLCDAYHMEQTVEKLKSGFYPVMNGTDCVLMEFSRWVLPEDTECCVEALVKAGYVPIIAHPEHYKNLRDDMGLIDRFRELGALIQVTASSLGQEELDDSVRSWARELVLKGKVDFLGTDAHDSGTRRPMAGSGLAWLRENLTPEAADAIIRGNARKLLLNGE